MSVLIDEFKREHSEIIETFKEIKELGVLTKEGHAKLMFLAPDLLAHFWKEDKQFYPVLRKASEHNKKLKEVLSLFVNGLEAVHGEMLNFFIKYSKGIIDSTFQREYERLFDALSKRIEHEEEILFLEYKTLQC